jgi:hypothetical protein
MANRPSRGRGILNERQRAYLTGESDIETGTANERSIRQAIRNNLQNALLDMVILERNLEERDRSQVFDAFDARHYDDPSVEHVGSRDEHERSLGDLLAFLYRGVKDREPTFQQLLQYAIPRGKHPKSAPYTPEYEIELSVRQLSPGPDDLERALDHLARDNLQALSETETRALLRMLRASDVIDLEALLAEFEDRMNALDECQEEAELSLLEFLRATELPPPELDLPEDYEA